MSEIKTYDNRNIQFKFENGYTVSLIPMQPGGVISVGEGFKDGSPLQEVLVWDENGDLFTFGDDRQVIVCECDEAARLLFEVSQIAK